jgi:hypothetical protein
LRTSSTCGVHAGPGNGADAKKRRKEKKEKKAKKRKKKRQKLEPVQDASVSPVRREEEQDEHEQGSPHASPSAANQLPADEQQHAIGTGHLQEIKTAMLGGLECSRS